MTAITPPRSNKTGSGRGGTIGVKLIILHRGNEGRYRGAALLPLIM